jgi:hypothetical protein
MVYDRPVLASIQDVPGDNGGHVRLTWKRSLYDSEGSSPLVKRYRVWRRVTEPASLGLDAEDSDLAGVIPPVDKRPYEHGEDGPVWEPVATVSATGQCSYTFDTQTTCDSSSGDPCWTKFYVSAHTGQVGQRFDSPVDSGYSVDNLLAEGSEGDRAQPVPPGPDDVVVATTCLGSPEPNPGAEGFVIRYDLAKSGWIELEVYDITGRSVVTLVDGHVDAGPHLARWDGRAADRSRVAPGIYFVRLMTLSEIHTAKLVLAR